MGHDRRPEDPRAGVGAARGRPWATWSSRASISRCRTRTRALVINQFLEIYEGTGPASRGSGTRTRIAIIFDHRVPAESRRRRRPTRRRSATSSPAQGIAKFHDIRGDVGGICHQILPENGYVRPGAVVVGTDSHTTSTARSARSPSASAPRRWRACGRSARCSTSRCRPPSRSSCDGQLPPSACGSKDLILHLIGTLTGRGRELQGARVPRRGDPDDAHRRARLVLCNMAVEAGATAGIVPGRRGDRALPARGSGRHATRSTRSRPTPTRRTTQVIEIDAAALAPHIACPHTVDNV